MKLTGVLTKFDQAWRSRLDPLASQARSAWQQRTRREQALLRGGALLIAAALLWMIALRPALHTIQNARGQLPVLQARATQLDAIILEAQALGRGRSGALTADETEAALKASLRNAGLDTVSALSTVDHVGANETQWQVQFTNAPAGRIIDWMAGLSFVAQVRTQQVDLTRSNVDGRDRLGQLSGIIVLALSSREAP